MRRKGGAVFWAALVVVVLSTAGALAATPFASLELHPASATAGQRVGGAGRGFVGGLRVEVHLGSSEGRLLWAGTADGAGAVGFAFTTPDVPPGSYAVVAFHPVASGSSAQATLQVVAPASPAETAPATGAPGAAAQPPVAAAAGSPPVPVRAGATRSVPLGPQSVDAPLVAPAAVLAPQAAEPQVAGPSSVVSRAFSRAEGFTPAGTALLTRLLAGKPADIAALVRLAVALQLGVALLAAASVVRRSAAT